MVKRFTVECEMNERWVDYFCSMLKNMQDLGNIGASDYVAIYSDGDGDFRPQFYFDINYDSVEPVNNEFTKNTGIIAYDAG